MLPPFQSSRGVGRGFLFFFATGLLPSILVFLAGCATPSQRHGEEEQFAPAPILGTVIHVDPLQNLVVARLHSPARMPPARLTTRNQQLTETGLLESTPHQRGRMLGARILSGLPNIGDEVIRWREPVKDAAPDN